jgi:hypothetical protein
MTETAAGDFDAIWNRPALQSRLAEHEAGTGGRQAGLWTKMLLLTVATLVGAVIAFVIWPPLALAVLGVGGVFVLAKRGDAKRNVADDLKATVLPHIAEGYG